MPDYECHICRTKMWWKNRIDPVCPKCDPEKAGIKSFNDQTACKELVDKTGRTEPAPMIQSVLDENIEFKEQLATVTAQRDLLKDALEKLFSWVDAYAETSDTEFPAVERLCVEALASPERRMKMTGIEIAIERMQELVTENADLKSTLHHAAQMEALDKATIAQQAAVIEQTREAFRVASMDTETINRKAPEIAKGCCSMPMPDTEGMYRLANEEVCNVVSSYLYWLHKNQPTALHPSPEILKQRDTMVICEFLERSGKWVVNDAIIAENARKAIQRDLEDAFKRDDEARADSNDYKPLGHACDRAQWEKVRRLWE